MSEVSEARYIGDAVDLAPRERGHAGMLLEEMTERIDRPESADLRHLIHPHRGHRQVVLRDFQTVHRDEL